MAKRSTWMEDYLSELALPSLYNLPPDVQEAYKLACEEGSRPSHVTRLMLVGHYGAGKTSLKRCLLNKPFLSDYNITNGIDVDPSACRVDITKASNWKHIEDEAVQDDSYNEEIVKAVSQLLLQGQEGSKGKTSSNKSTAKAGTGRRTAATQAAKDAPLVEPDRDLLWQLEDVKSKPVNHNHQEEFSVWDFAGQSTYYTTHQVFLTYRAIYLVVLNIMQALDSPIDTDQLGFKETAQNGISSQAVIDQLDYWLNCVYSHTASHRTESTPAESIIIVLTHKDQLKQKYPATAGQKIRDYRRTIIKHITTKVYCEHVDLEFFVIANNIEDDPEIHRLRETIVDLARSQPYWGEEIPLRWIALRDCLREKKKFDYHVVTLKEAWRMCKDPKVGIRRKKELCHVLKFYHETGEFVFFDENNLRDYIILEPQWLIDAISSVITLPRFHEMSESRRSAQMWQVLQTHGLLTERILDAVWEEDVKQHLTHLMYKFRLMLPMRVCNMTEVHGKMLQLRIADSKAFLVPCLLPLQKSLESRSDLFWPIPEILVLFDDGFIPVGITSHLISGLVMNEAWLLTGEVFQNHANFLPEGQNTNLSITIHQHEDRLHLQGHILDDKPTCPNPLRPYLFVLLEQLGFVIRSTCPKATIELAVECRCDVPERSIVKVGSTGEWIEGNSYIYCHQHSTKFLTDSYSAWFDVKSVTRLTNSAGIGNLNDRTLLSVAKQLGPGWRDLGYLLLAGPIVDELCTPLQGGPGLFCLRMLVVWYQSLDRADISFMKGRLIQALKGEGRTDLVQIIREYDGPNEQQLFHKLSRGLTKNWRKLGEKLGVDAGEMDVIETPQMPDYNPGLRMLVTWRNQGGCRTELITHLKELKHHTIAQSLELEEI